MLNLAIETAKAAGDLALSYFDKQTKIFYKKDASPVTHADREAELLIRKIISKQFPNHGFIGEEFPSVNPKAKYQWVIDPIDGTKQFIRGIPFWGTLLALLENGKPIIGVSYFPVSGDLAYAQKNKGTYINSKKVRVSRHSKLDHAYMIHGSVDDFDDLNLISNFLKICKKVEGKRGYGDSWGYNLIISGRADIMLEAHVYIQDVAATSLLVEEAGGKFTDFSGKFSITSGNALATNGLWHEEILKLLNA